MSNIIQRKIISHFKETKEYKDRRGILHKEDSIMLEFIQSKCSKGKILEVGGGSGAFLDLILQKSPHIGAYNLEIAYEVYKNQINENIKLIEGNALCLPFESDEFDFIVAKNLLHHIVSSSRKKSKNYANKAIEEMVRVVKNKGYIVILEQYNNNRLFALMIFYITLISSIIGINISSFGWDKNVIVSFLTPLELKTIFEKNGINIEIYNKNRFFVSKKWKYTILMSNIGRVLMIGSIDKSNLN